MASIRALRPARRLTAALALVALAPVLTACGPDEPLEDAGAVASISHGPCIPTFGNRVIAADMSMDGNTILYLSSSRPATLPEEQGWGGGDRAIEVLKIDESGSARSRHIATSWSANASIQPYATESAGRKPAEISLPEQMTGIDMDDEAASFVVGVKRRGSIGVYSQLYYGAIPATGTANLNPEDGLSLVEISSPSGVEGISDFWIAPDGSKVAAIVGPLSELRVYDLNAESNNLYVYERDAEGAMVVSNTMPEASTSLEVSRRPAITSRGSMRAVWSPDASKLALVRTEGESAVGRSVLNILDVASGELTEVTKYEASAAPHVAWAADNGSLWVLNTPLGSSGDSVFGNAQIRHIQAAEGGKEIGSGASLPRQLGWTTDPGSLARFKDGESLVYTWEGRIYRLDLPNGDLAGAESAYMLLRADVPSDLKVLPGTPRASAQSDRVMFMIQDRAGTHVALRTEASADACSIEDTSQEEEAAPADEG